MMDDDDNGPLHCDRVEKESVEDKLRDSKSHLYTCNICQKVYADKKYYKHHITFVHGSYSYKCDQCDRTFKCQRYLTVHKKSLHSTDGVRKCTVCDKYVSWRSLRQHMVNIHSGGCVKRWLCKVCGENFKTDHCLQLHLLDVHGQQPANFNIFICDYCRKTFTKKHSLQKHISFAHARAYYKCNQCESSFRCKQYLAVHKASKHVAHTTCKVCGKLLKPVSMVRHMQQLHSDKQLQCIVCGENIMSKYNFEQHMKEHRGQPSAMTTSSQLSEYYVTASKKRVCTELYNCEKCVQTFMSKDTFRQHNNLAHSTEPDKNNKCNKEFNLESYFHKHTSRNGKLQYECAVCKKILKSKYGLIGHVTHYHRPKPTGGAESNVYICDYCQKMFSSKLWLIHHMNSTHASKSYKCKQCGKSYKWKRSLDNHTASTHTALIECNVCGKLMRLFSLIEHIRNMHSDKKLQCRICGEIVTSKHRLHIHMNDVHSEQSEASPFRCDHCQKVYASKKCLNAHIKNLHGTIFHRCSQCKRIFKSKTNLMKHIKKKHKASPFRCDHCPKAYPRCKSFKSKAALRKHIKKKHIKKKHKALPLTCDHCQKVYTSKIWLSSHIKNFHGQDRIRCSQCEDSFKTETTLQRHIKKKHKDSKHQSMCSEMGVESGASSHPPVGEVNTQASIITQQIDVVVKKEEPADDELDLGPVMFQHMDSNYRLYKEEPLLD